MKERDGLSGTTFAGRYQVERQLGVGGMGAVYLATQEPLGRQVALKVLRPQLLGDPVAVERFKNEARIVAQLGHPHIVGIHEFGTTDDDVLFIAMEYLPGESLGSLLRREACLPWQRTLPIVRGIARALSAAHRRSIVHRDLKPDNIILAEAAGMTDFVKVLDFGIAKLVAAKENAPNLTGTGFVPGTPGYIAPEQIMGGGSDDPRGDLYSLGITWFEMLAGRRPYEGDSAMRVFLAHLNEPTPKLKDKHPGVDVPAPVEAILDALLAKDPAARPASADAFLAMLDGLGLSTESAPATPSSPFGSVAYDPGVVATMTSLSTPGTSVRAMGDDVRPRLGAPVAAQAMMPPAPAMPDATSSPAGPAPITVESLIVERNRWVKRTIAFVALLVIVIAGVAIGAFRSFARGNDQFGELPLHEDIDSEGGRALVEGVTAFLEADLPRARAASRRALAAAPTDPAVLAFSAVVRDEFDPARATRFAEAKANIAFGDHHPHGGVEVVELLADASSSDVPIEAVLQRYASCGTTCDDNPFFLVAFGHALASVNRNQIDEAAAAFDAAARRKKRLVAPYEGKASAFLAAGRFHDAVAAADVGLRENPDAAPLLLVAGRAHLASGELADAVRQLKLAVSNGAGDAAQLALAQAYVLLPDGEDKRRIVIDSLLQTGTPTAKCLVAREHGGALVGAGRGNAALELLRACMESGASADEATGTWLHAVESFEALDDPGLWQRHAALGVRLNRDHGAGQMIPAIAGLADVVQAYDGGKTGDARAKLDELVAIEKWPAGAKEDVLAYVRARVLSLEGKPDEAIAAAAQIRKPCVRHLRSAVVLERAKRFAEADEHLDWLIDKHDYCRQAGAQGGHLLEAVVMKAERRAQEDPVGAAVQLREHLRWFPRAEPEMLMMKRARALLDRGAGQP